MRSWVFAALPLALAALIAGEFFRTPPANSAPALLRSLSRDLKFAYHSCVPLGWKPVAVSGTYYPGYTASAANYEEWLDAIWRGRIRKADLRNPQAAEVLATLDHLAKAGLLRRRDDAGGYDYFLTPQALPYYYGSSMFDDNHDSLPYLCYSTIVPQRIDWMQAIAVPQGFRRPSPAHWYQLQFSWKPSAPAVWADSFIQAHSVVLAPITSPTTAKVVYVDDQWSLLNVYDRGWMLPALTHARQK